MLQFTFAGFEVQQMVKGESILTITARALTKTRTCPSCGEETSHVHSYYPRHPQDLPISGLQVQLVLRVRRFRCLNSECPRQTFAERLPELPVSARQTSRLGTLLESIAVVLSGQAGSRLAEQLAMPVSADTLLRRAKKKAQALPTPRVLGVDDPRDTHQCVYLSSALKGRAAGSSSILASLRLGRGCMVYRLWQQAKYVRSRTARREGSASLVDF